MVSVETDDDEQWACVFAFEWIGQWSIDVRALNAQIPMRSENVSYFSFASEWFIFSK